MANTFVAVKLSVFSAFFTFPSFSIFVQANEFALEHKHSVFLSNRYVFCNCNVMY